MSNEITVKDKTYIVTGASKGIGAATARILLTQGANVVLHWNTTMSEAENLLKEYGDDRCVAIRANLENRDEVDALWAAGLAWKGKLDGIVNNAAVMLETDPENGLDEYRKDWDTVMEVNVRAVADLCWHAVDYFKSVGGGSIVNVASRAAFRGDMPDSVHYAASKGAVVAMTRSIAKGYAADGIYAYIIAPGWVGTETVMPRLNDPANANMIKEIPMQAPCPPEEVGNIIAFMLSGAVKNATGTTFDINGASYFH
jgi:NAD(P)-dependent dehydrogenase (short-subunit alcohol dehydrogenase family)